MISSTFFLILRVSVLAAVAFLFVVLFEHGPENYLLNAREDFARLMDALAAATAPAGEKTSGSGT